ncbi:MAG: hypothetical protein ACJ77E_19665 [Gaiellaceae bacterium]
MSFEALFPPDDPPRQEEMDPWLEHARPAWLGPPVGELGGVVALGLVLGRSDRGVVALSHAVAYSTGVALDVVAYAGGLDPRAAQAVFHDQHAARFSADELPSGFLRLGIELPDGRRVSNTSARQHHLPHGDSPTAPVLIQAGGGGGQTGRTSVSWNASFWLWPLPAAGVLRITCEWPIAGIPVSTVEVDAAEMVAASAKAARIFDEGEGGPAGPSSASHQYVLARSSGEATSVAADEPGGGPADVAAELRSAQQSLARALATLDRLRQ